MDIKVIKENAKDLAKDIKDAVVDFKEDTVDYLGDHPLVISAIAFGAIKLIGLGVDLTQKGNIEVRKDGLSEIYTNRFVKLERKMSFDEWFNYLEEMYSHKWNRKFQKNYLKENGFIK